MDEHETSFCNPFWSENFPDPFILKVRGRYFAYGTEGEMHPTPGVPVFPILTSPDLVQWSYVGKALPALEKPFFGYWAPEVTVHNDQFLLYYAVHTEEFVASIRVAVADRPEGPFVDSGRDLTSHLVPWAIDPHVFRDQDGQWYLYMTIEMWDNPAGFTGVGNVVDRLIDPFTLQGNVTLVTPPRHAWQLYQAKRQERKGVDWYTVEGPAVLRHRALYYQMFSGGCYYRDNYAVNYATSNTPMGQGGMQDSSWHDWEGSADKILFIKGNSPSAMSPGHNSFVLGPNNADLYIAYHVLQSDRIARYPYLDRLFWHGDTPWTPAPISTPQPVPALPRLLERFEGDALRSDWQQDSGRWSVSNGAARQEDATASHASLRYRPSLSAAWLLEVNLRHISGNGSYGVLLYGEDSSVPRVTLSSDGQLAVWSSRSSKEPLQKLSLPDTMVIQSWHQLVLSLSGSLLRVQFDYLRPLEVELEQPVHTFALLTEGCSAAFSGISLTDHFRDEFLNEQQTPALLGWQKEQQATTEASEQESTLLQDWQVRDGAFVQSSLAQGEHIVLKGPLLEQYECGATMQLHQTSTDGSSAFGLVIWHSIEEKRFVWLLQRQSSWMLTVEIATVGAQFIAPIMNHSVDLPETFDPLSWHTIRLVRSNDQLTVYLDGPEVLTLPFPSRPEKLGLATRNAAANFTSVWQTGFVTASWGNPWWLLLQLGSARLLAVRLIGLFDIRRQQ